MTLLQQAVRNGFVVAGALLLTIGIADILAGRAKLHEYRTLLAEAPPPEARNPAALFPKASEAQERRAVAEAKLAFYELLLLAGQLLVTAGGLLVGIGILRERHRALQAAPASLRLH